MNFEASSDPQIFLAPATQDTHLHFAYILPKGGSYPQNSIGAADALEHGDGSFCFSTVPVGSNTLDVVDRLQGERAGSKPRRFIVWICEVETGDLVPKTVTSFAPNAKGAMVLTMPLVVVVETGHLNAHVPQGSEIEFNAEGSAGLVITGSDGAAIQTHGLAEFRFDNPQPVHIDFEGANRGFPRCTMNVDLGDLLDKMPVGFRYTVPGAAGKGTPQSYFFSLFHPPDSGASAAMELVIDPFTADYDIEGLARSSINFVKQGETIPPLASNFRTREGYPVLLRPATGADDVEAASFRFASHGASPELLYLDPAGDFWPGTESSPEVCDLMCGLSATEILRLNVVSDTDGGDRVRFSPGMPANAPQFPLPVSSPMAPPRPPTTPFLDDRATTSWLSAIPRAGQSVHYAAQPSDNPLYGRDGVIYAHNDSWLGFVEPGVALNSDPPRAAPVIPYLGLEPRTAAFAAGDFERQIVAPARRRAFMESKPKATQQIRGTGPSAESPSTMRATTPQGLIVSIGADGRWTEVNLALSNHGRQHLRFLNLSSELQRVFQAQQIFAVIVNPAHVGTPGQTPGFDNAVSMDGWSMAVDVGRGSDYGHYSNVFVLKFRPGKLTDLAKNTAVWNQGAVLSVMEPDENPLEIAAVSQWLQDYIATAQQREDEGTAIDPEYSFYKRFLELAEDENWSGVLALKVDITEIPAELGGLLDGIDTSRFFAHHIGVDINPIEGTDIEFKHDSAIFGLIDYVDPRYRPDAPRQPVPPQSDGAYEFTVLTLQASFENTRVKAFKSRAQLVMAELFGASVDSIVDDKGNAAGAVILDGRYQKHGDHDGFVMETDIPAVANLKSTVLPRTRISRIQYTTVEEKGSALVGLEPERRLHVRFNIRGSLDFVQLPDNDVFSFGSSDAGRTAGGLPFSNLILDLLPDRDERGDQQFVFNIADIRFGTEQAKAREGSLYEAFPLSDLRLLGGPGAASPTSLGYLPVGGDSRFGQISGAWYGVSYRLDLGTPGELVSHIGFEADLLLAWEPSESADAEHVPAFVGLKLPGTEGAGVLGLQGVIKVTIDDIELIPIAEKDEPVTYLLRLNDIALSLMGLKKIPSSSGTDFFLFANPDRGAAGSALGWYAIYNPSAERGSDKALPAEPS